MRVEKSEKTPKEQAEMEYMLAQVPKLEAHLQYVAMMADVDLLEQEEGEKYV